MMLRGSDEPTFGDPITRHDRRDGSLARIEISDLGDQVEAFADFQGASSPPTVSKARWNGKPTPGFEPGTPSLRVKCSTS
jgi:hypothetical protein